ncbi:MAG: A24 family peptidase [Phycisphaeraceae bacterium]|nr:A24 family peptidase [Phycisphaeraceae bacterium]
MLDMPLLIASILMGVLLVVAAGYDIVEQRIPNRLTYSAIVAGIGYWTLAGLTQGGPSGALEGLTVSTFTTALAALPMVIIFSMGGLGGGDVKLAAAIGAWVANPLIVLAAGFYAFTAAMLMSIVVMCRQRVVGRTFRRLLSAAIAASTKTEWAAPEDSPRIPFAVSLAVGGITATTLTLTIGAPWPMT